MKIPPHLDDPNPYRDADPYDDGRDPVMPVVSEPASVTKLAAVSIEAIEAPPLHNSSSIN